MGGLIKSIIGIILRVKLPKKPFIIAKWALSMDGRMIVNAGDDRRISGVDASMHTQWLRRLVDGVMVGAENHYSGQSTLKLAR